MIKTATPLAKDNMGLAYAVVQRIGLDNGISIQDSEEFSDACIGLINAEMNYNPERAKFSTFAYTLCYREVIKGKQRRYKKRHFSFGCLNDKDLTEKLIDKNLFVPYKLEKHEKKDLLFKLLECSGLNERDLDIVKSYYCFDITQVALGEKYGLSKQRVSQIIVETISKIRKHNKSLIKKCEGLLD